MKCKECQDFLLTGYVDDEISGRNRHEVDVHLKACAACREFAMAVRQTAVEPFTGLKQEQPPESVWQNIKQSLEEEVSEPETDWIGTILERLFPWPRPVLTLGVTMAVLVFVMTIVLNMKPSPQIVQKENTQESVEYLDSVLDQLAYTNGEDDEGYNTAIEEYFL